MTTVRQYVRAEPKTDIDALRRSVPDDPIRLPPGHLTCEGCGIAHRGPAILSAPTMFDVKGRAVQVAPFTRCPDCQRLDDHACGDERTRFTLYALAAINVPVPEDPGPLVPWMQAIGSRVGWLVPDALNKHGLKVDHDLLKVGWCNPYPWAHVGLSHRAAIKEAYLLALRDRIRNNAPALHLPPPWGGACLFCGIGSVPMAPLEVARKGGREDAARAVWRSVVAQPRAFGARGPDMIDGFVCSTCAGPLESAGSVNRGCARAFEEHARREGIRVPTDLFDLYVDGRPVEVPGWASLGKTSPNAKPWEHIALVEEDVPEPEFIAP